MCKGVGCKVVWGALLSKSTLNNFFTSMLKLFPSKISYSLILKNVYNFNILGVLVLGFLIQDRNQSRILYRIRSRTPAPDPGCPAAWLGSHTDTTIFLFPKTKQNTGKNVLKIGPKSCEIREKIDPVN